jgi:hypothetical protein
MKGCMDHIHLAIKVSIQKVTQAYRLLVAIPAVGAEISPDTN